MSDGRSIPIDENALDAFLNDIVAGRPIERDPSAQLPADVVQAIRHITSLDPSPQSGAVRERAWAETWDHIQQQRSEQESTMYASAVATGSQAVQSSSSPVPSGPRERGWSGEFPRGWAAAAALLVLLVTAFAAYAAFGPGRPNSDNGPVIPAVVIQEGSPTPTPAGTPIFRIDLPASSVLSTGTLTSGWDYIVVRATQRTYNYTPNCCPGPFLEYVLEGQLAAQSERPMTIVRADGAQEAIPAGTEVTLFTGDAFLAENDANMDLHNPGATDTHLLGWVLVNDLAFQGHGAAGFAQTLAVDLEFEMQVSPGPGTLVLTRYDDPAEIPAEPAPNSYQYILYAGGNALGTPEIGTTPSAPSGTPAPPAPGEGIYVLDFLMSPPATPSPVAATPIS